MLFSFIRPEGGGGFGDDFDHPRQLHDIAHNGTERAALTAKHQAG